MTTIKQYKAMIDGATEGLLPCPFCGGEANPSSYHPKLGDVEYGVSCAYCGCERSGYSSRDNANAIWNTRADKLTPELIRVMELAEEGLDYALSQMQPFCSDEKVKQALSEIRKLRGE